MKVRLAKASNFRWEEEVDIDTFADVLDLCKKYNNDIIVSLGLDGDVLIWIYDDYME